MAQVNTKTRTVLTPKTGDELPSNVKPLGSMSKEEVAGAVESVKIVEGPNGRTRSNEFDRLIEDREKAADGKIATVQVFQQKIAQAFDTYKEADGKGKEAQAIASEASILIAKDAAKRITSAMEAKTAKSEISGFLCNQFGSKEKGGKGMVPSIDPNASKTPHGKGEDIRKRIVRLLDAMNYVSGAEETPFFTDLPLEEVQDIIDRVYETDKAKNPLSVWSAYDMLGDVRKKANEAALPFPLNVKKVAKLADDIASTVNDIVSAQRADGALKAAYVALFAQLKNIGEALAIEDDG